nr:hypothetical protein [Tanacetum cinerariifolium]
MAHVIEKPQLVAINNRTLSLENVADQLRMSAHQLRSRLNANDISLWYEPTVVIRSAGIPGFLDLMEDYFNRPPDHPLVRGHYRLHYKNGVKRFYIESHKDYSSYLALFKEVKIPLLADILMKLWVTVVKGPRVERLLTFPVEEAGFQPAPNNN